MSYYIRKISRSKWPKEIANAKVADVRADAITGCLRTTEDKLSLWKVERIGNPEEDLLPLITGFEKPNRCEVVYIDEKLLIDAKVDLVQEKGNTPLKELQDTHYDAIVNNYEGLGTFAQIILTVLNEENTSVRISDKKVAQIIKSLVEDGKINKEDLNTKMQEKLGYV